MRYRYNAENRLIVVESQNPVDGDAKLEYTYDYIGRRVKKTVSTYESGFWSPTSDHLFLYDGWNLVKEISADTGQPATDKYYVWGLDLSQSQQGAGGIGGLLASVEGSLTHCFYYDGNGNVGQLVNISDGAIAAHYEYDPFGNSIFANGPEADNNPYQFSTKYYDSETELYFYGYRYYSPDLGRWLNRDPLGEYGGQNLYAFVENNSLTSIDYIGLAQVTESVTWKSPYIYYGDTFSKKPMNHGAYIIEFRVTYDNKSERISKVEIIKEHQGKYWSNENSELSFGVFRRPVKYIDCLAQFEQQLTVSTRDAGEFITNLTTGYVNKIVPIPGTKIIKFLLGKATKKATGESGDAYNTEFMFHVATLKTTFNFWIAKGSLIFIPENENQVAGNRLRFQDELETQDQHFMNLDEDDLRITLEVMQLPEEKIKHLIEERNKWLQ